MTIIDLINQFSKLENCPLCKPKLIYERDGRNYCQKYIIHNGINLNHFQYRNEDIRFYYEEICLSINIYYQVTQKITRFDNKINISMQEFLYTLEKIKLLNDLE
ncbi:MAG: hypothetical protein LC122_12020 [Chitinophagales bacterium]|nr:hypothetical protein [Chitinophagales bacterium]